VSTKPKIGRRASSIARSVRRAGRFGAIAGATLALGVGVGTRAGATTGFSRAPAGGGVAGGGDFTGGRVEIPAGGRLGATHAVYLVNSTGSPVRAAFTAGAPRGITVEPARADVSVGAGHTEYVPYSVRVANTVAPGSYRVTVGLRRSDVAPVKGAVVFVPAVSQDFTLVVVGTSARVRVRALDRVTSRPVVGTISLVRMAGRVEIDRTTGSALDAVVAPGTYEARFLLGTKTLARVAVAAVAGREASADLRVDSVVLSGIQAVPVFQEHTRHVAYVRISGTIENRFEPLASSSVRVSVRRDGRRVATQRLARFDPLPNGTTRFEGVQVENDGWPAGEYRYAVQLVTPGFSVSAGEEAAVRVPSWTAPTQWPWLIGVLLALGVALAARGLRNRRNRLVRFRASPHVPRRATE